MPANYVLLEKITVGAAGASSVTFSGIPQTGYTDLAVKFSARSDRAGNTDSPMRLYPNGSSTGITLKFLQGNGSAASSGTEAAFAAYMGETPAATATASTFGNGEIYIPNYTSSNYKSISTDVVTENNATAVKTQMFAYLWSNTAAITSLQILDGLGNFVANSTFYLYGVAKLGTTPAIQPYATGGDTIMTDGTYWYHAFKSSGTFTPAKGLSVDYLVVAGGGGGARGADNTGSGGGGAGGFRTSTGFSCSSGIGLTVTVGAGGAAGTVINTQGPAGSNSVFSTVTSTGGAGGISQYSARASGGSGGGGESFTASGAGSAGNAGSFSPVEGYAGGSAGPQTQRYGGGGGGGSSAIGGTGSNTAGGDGGAGTSSSYSGSAVTYAGGGGGGLGGGTGGTGGIGAAGGGNGGTDSVAGGTASANSGSGGGGGCGKAGVATNGGAGGSGIVLVRYLV